MTTPNPATPAPAAAPGTVPQNSPQAPAPAPAPDAPAQAPQGANQGGVVTMSTDEFRQLSRDAARGRARGPRATGRGGSNANPSDEPVDAQVSAAQAERDDANRRAMQSDVRLRVRDILDKKEYAALPESTKAIIIERPHMLSEADNADDALLDIEDFVREQVAGMTIPNAVPGQPPVAQPQPQGHTAPPNVAAGAPAPAASTELEDISKLHGPAKTQAMIRNSVKTARGVKTS